MTDPYPVPVFGKAPEAPALQSPGSKSLTNRSLLLAALGRGQVALEGALFSRDSRLMSAALRDCGLHCEANEERATFSVSGAAGGIPKQEASLHVGNAGTAARFLTAWLALGEGGIYRVDGDEAMYRRPIAGLTQALEAHGAATFDFHGTEHAIPYTMHARGLGGGEIVVDASASSQILSALLMVAAHAREPLAVRLAGETVSHPFVHMTCEQMKAFGYTVTIDGPCYHVRAPEAVLPATYAIEADASAASYFLALPIAVGGSVEVALPEPSLQGDAVFSQVLERTGLTVERQGGSLAVSHRPGLRGTSTDFNAFSDTFLTLAALAPLLEGPTHISGIAHTRHQETDRVHAMATELKRLGQAVEETEDALTIHPRPLQPATIETYEDHRIAMSFGILGCHDLHGNGESWLSIQDPLCCAKTFPHFFDILEQLQHQSLS